MLTRNLLYLATLFSLSAALPQATDATTSTAAVTGSSSSDPSATGIASPTTDTTSQSASVSAPVTSGNSTTTSAPVSAPVASGNSTITSSAPTGSLNSTSTVSSSAPLPTVTGVQLHPNGNTAKCLDVKGNIRANGTPVQIFDCNGTPAQQWTISPGEGPVVLAGTNFCLDAGSTPANGVGMKIWECFSNLAAQDWFYTADQRIALTGKGFCLDLTEGLVANSNRVQTWHCTTNDVNQVWSTGAVVTPSSTATITTTVGPSTSPVTSSKPAPSSFKLHPNGNNAKCLDVKGNKRANGTPVQIFDCNGTSAQQWVVSPGEGHVVLAGTNFCLDAGTNPANGIGMKIWQCFSNLAAQDWFYTDDKRIALTGKGFCLDLTNGNLVDSNRVQTWKCTNNNKNQVWSTGN